ncbi:desert hedgehog protein A-like isoform X2 [Gigantopelta aegis]|uniref:desert hedgehog protein A-like isoform X2 n=1 Tax=Gigantopelta aegis TaxID=1735272 RepID=UPI001B8877C7|nr:desert hedgehog protein A-like isoform X2 [Gigantopelta aegis]
MCVDRYRMKRDSLAMDARKPDSCVIVIKIMTLFVAAMLVLCLGQGTFARLDCQGMRCHGRGFVGTDCRCWCSANPVVYCDSGDVAPDERKRNLLTLPKPREILLPHRPLKVKVQKATEEEEEAACFPGDAQLELDNGDTVNMKELKVGQRVLTVINGERVFVTVRTFLKRRPLLNATYVTLTTVDGNHVSLSSDHLIFTSVNTSSKMEARFAGSVKPGDYLYSTKRCPRGQCAERVADVSISRKQGAFVPVTDDGTVVVNGMLASCYTTVSHDVAHVFVTPFRWFPWLLARHQHDGYSPLVSLLSSVGRMVLSKD